MPTSRPKSLSTPFHDLHARALLELSFDAIIVRDVKDRIIYFNRGAEEMYGWSRSEVYGKVSHQQFQTRFPEPLAAIRKRLVEEGRWVGELGHVRRDGSSLIVSTRWAVQRDDAGQIIGVLETNTDITARKRAEDSLRQREEELAAFFHDSPLALLWLNANGSILRTNRAGLELLGRSWDELRGYPVALFSPDPARTREFLQKLAEGSVLSNLRWTVRHRDGTLRHVVVDANGWWQSGHLVSSRWFLRDITRRVELETELLAISEREQRRIGQDLHDDLCQQLTGIEFLSQSLATALARKRRPESRQAQEITSVVRLAIGKSRAIARGLCPISLQEDGLTSALMELAGQTRLVFGKRCRFRCPTPVRLPDHGAAVHLYRIAQEAVANAVKHSDAAHIEISLNKREDKVELEIRDDGTGFTPEPSLWTGMGLHSMAQRAEIMGATLTVRANAPTGTVVRCDLRVRPVEDAS